MALSHKLKPLTLPNRFADRDMLMRYHWGLGIGHTYSNGCASDYGLNNSIALGANQNKHSDVDEQGEQNTDGLVCMAHAGIDDDGDGLGDPELGLEERGGDPELDVSSGSESEDETGGRFEDDDDDAEELVELMDMYE